MGGYPRNTKHSSTYKGEEREKAGKGSGRTYTNVHRDMGKHTHTPMINPRVD